MNDSEQKNAQGPDDTPLSVEEQTFANLAQAHLRSMERELDAATADKLRQARARAVDQAQSPWLGFFRSPQGYALGGVTAAVFLAVMIAPVFRVNQPAIAALPVSNGDEFVLAQESELLEELEFVAWMLENEALGEEGTSL